MSLFAPISDRGASSLHLRNLLQVLGTTSLKTMDLRALLFSADGSSTAVLCQVMTDLGIQAEICAERLVAAQQIAREQYDAIIVDWDLEQEAILLLKGAREQKAQGLNLALVQDDAAIARAWQSGANSVIKKPIDPEQARETLGTARDLIVSRRTEQRDKENRLIAAQEQSEVFPGAEHEEAPAAKSGFLPQSMPRSALEAEENVGRPDTSAELRWQAARGPRSMEETEEPAPAEIQPVSKQRWDEVKSIFRQPLTTEANAPVPAEPPTSEDSTGVFSSLPEEPAAEVVPEPSSPPRYVVIAVAASVLIAGLLYVWAPGGSYSRPLSSLVHAFSAKAKPQPMPAKTHTDTAPSVASEKPVAAPTGKPEDEFPDPGPIASTDVDPSKIQIIETKVVPKTGAQQPPSNQATPDPDQSKPQSDSENTTPPSIAESTPPPVTTPVPQAVSAAPVPVAPPPPAVHTTPENSRPASEGRVGVIIPDSLRNTPAPSPASSLEPFAVPEPVALSWIIHRVDPDYPAQAMQQKIEGPVVLQAWVGKDGSVRDLKLVKGYFVLGRIAIDAVRQWRFKPFTPNGKATDFQTSITVNFRYPN